MTGMISDCRKLSLAYSIQVLILYASPILILSIIYTIYIMYRVRVCLSVSQSGVAV